MSHIINAEGEKLQYVLGTLETCGCKEPDIDEILKVNQSVTCLLDSVSQNQMILKNKMDKALHALSDVCRNPIYPPCPPKPPAPSCACPPKCCAVFKTGEKCRTWHSNSALPWDTEHLHGKCACIDSCNKSKIELRSKGRFEVNFSVNVRAKCCKRSAAISLQMIKNHQRKCVHTVCGYIPCDDEAVTISAGGIIVENSDHTPSFLLLELDSPESLTVDSSMLSIVEI